MHTKNRRIYRYFTCMIENSLKKLGLADNEAAVYLALLELGKGNVASLTKKAHLPRSTVYSVLASLQIKGLIFSYLQKKTLIYSVHDPKAFLLEAENHLKAAQDILPDLKSLYRSAQGRPHIRYYDGREEMRQMYEGLLKIKNLTAYDIICSEETWLSMDQRFFEHFKARRAAKKIKTRLILEHSSTSLARKEREEQTYSEVKIIPPGLRWSVAAGCYIFKDRVIFLGYKREQIAVEILSEEIAQLQQMNFEFMWRFLSR